MAVTITRTPWIDDDGTGTTGTVINNAVKTDLYNQIDGALAKVAQLAGGNSFTGAQAMAGMLTVGSAFTVTQAGAVLVNTPTALVNAIVSIAVDGTVAPSFALKNTSASNFINFQLFLNSTDASAGAIQQTGATSISYLTTSDARLKDDAGQAADLSALRAIVVHDFTWKADGMRDRGVFGQEAHGSFPRAVTRGDEADDASVRHPWMVDYSKFVADLIVGWQHHDTELAQLRALLSNKGTVHE
jgi:Chaperone of endosialidase